MYSKNPREEIFELLVNSCIKNILSKNTLDGDTGITGPKLFGKVAQKLLNYLQKGSEFTHNNLKIKINQNLKYQNMVVHLL